MQIRLHSITPEPEATLIEVARVSSTREDKREDYAGLVRYLIRNQHWSPFEHAFMTIEIVTSRAIGRQILRHRSFTFQEFSQRYATATDFEPIELRRQAETNRQSSTEVFDPEIRLGKLEGAPTAPASYLIEKHLRDTETLYKRLLEAGVAKECARMILPECTQTTLYMSGSLRSWIHFLQLRDDEHAQKEVQEIAREIKKIFVEHCPITSEALGWTS